MLVKVIQMNKMTELIVVVGAIIALACAVVAVIATTGTVAATTWDVFQGIVVVMIAIFIVGVILIADETRIDYKLKKMSTGII